MANYNLDILINANDQATKALKSVQWEFEWIKKSAKSASETIKNMQPTFEKMAGYWTVATTALWYGFNKAIDTAVDLWESINAVNVVFWEWADEILKYWQNAAKTVWLSNQAFNQLSTETWTLLKATWMSLDEVADETINLTERASDLASVFNTDVELAMSAINQALRWETEAIRRFWSDVTDASLEQFLLSQWINKTTSELTQQEKTLYRMQKIIADTNQVQWDFINTSDSLANRQRIMSAETTNTTAKFWELLIPIKQLVFDAIQPAIEKISTFIEKNPELAKTIAVVTISVTWLVAVIWTLWLVIPTIITWFATLKTATIALWGALRFLALNPIWLVITAIAAWIAIWIAIVKNWDTIKAKAIEIWTYILELYEKYKILFSIFAPLIAIWIELYKNWDTVKIYAIALWKTIKIVANNIWTAWRDAWDNIKFIMQQLKSTLSDIWNNIKENITGIVDNIVESVTDKFNALVETVQKVFDTISWIYNKAKNLASKASELVWWAVSWVKNLVSWERANWWAVTWGRTYLVGERWPELWTAPNSGTIIPNKDLTSWWQTININVTWNNFSNEADEDRLVEKIKQSLTREISLAKNFGIS